MTLQEQIDGLPRWPREHPITLRPDEVEDWHHRTANAALARLALAREVIATRVQVRSSEDFDVLNALLAALEPPK